MIRNLPSLRVLPSCFAVLLLAIQMSGATVLIFNADNIATGPLFGRGGGTGFTGNWYGSNNPSVVSGGLTSSLYNVPQPGTQHIIGSNNGAVRQEFRNVLTSPTGEVWFSFLTRVDDSSTGLSFESAGITVNPSSTATPFDNRGDFYLVQSGKTIEYSFGAGTASSFTDSRNMSGVANTYNSLFVGRLVINGGGAADTVTVWFNPDLIANPNINTYTPFYTNTTVNALDSINILGVAVYQQGSLGGGEIDNIRFSDGGGNATQAYMDVTNIPEPSSFLLLALTLPTLLLRRRV